MTRRGRGLTIRTHLPVFFLFSSKKKLFSRYTFSHQSFSPSSRAFLLLLLIIIILSLLSCVHIIPFPLCFPILLRFSTSFFFLSLLSYFNLHLSTRLSILPLPDLLLLLRFLSLLPLSFTSWAFINCDFYIISLDSVDQGTICSAESREVRIVKSVPDQY